MWGDWARRRAVRRAARAVAAVLASVVVLAMPAAAAADRESARDSDRDSDRDSARTVDEIAAALKDDPVLVQQVFGNGDAAGAAERIRATVAESEHPIYVALVADPGGLADKLPSQDLASKLHKRLGDGYYIVQVTRSILMVEGWGVPDPVSLSLARNDAVQAVTEANMHLEPGRLRVTPTAEALIVSEMAVDGEPFAMDPDRAIEIANLPGNVAPEDYSLLDDSEPATPGSRAVIATAVGVGTLLVGLRLLLWLTAPRRRGPRGAAASWTVTDLDLADLVARAEQETTRLSHDLAKAPPGPYADTAAGYQSAADSVLRGLMTPAEPGGRRYGPQLREAVGALVLAQAGRAELGRHGRKEDPGPYRPCFFDPLHGRATGTVDVPGRGDLEVPACRPCAASVSNGRTPDALAFAFPSRRRPRPYYEERTVWARTGYGALDDAWWSTLLSLRPGAGR